VNDRETPVEQYVRLLRADLATPEVLAGLHELLARDRNALREYVRAMHFQASLHWLLEGQIPGDVAVRAEVRRQLRAWRRRWLWRTAATVVAATLLLGLGTILGLRNSVREIPIDLVVGQLESAHATQWHGAALARPGAVLRIGREYLLQAGLVQLQLANGARINLEAPAAWRLEGANRLRLHNGRLTADVPPTAAGFTVDTGTAQAMDLGTRFGAVVGLDAAPEFHVFEGRVETGGPKLPVAVLNETEAARFAADGTSQQRIAATPEAFVACLQFAAGVAELTGQARFATQPLVELRDPQRFDPRAFHLFLERRQMTLPAELSIIPANVLDEFDTKTAPPHATLSAGTSVDCYFVHFHARGEGTVRGQITFQRPVVGLILESPAMNETDAVFCPPGVSYLPPMSAKTNRGGVISPTGAGGPPDARTPNDDRLTLSPDRRTVTLQLHTAADDLDQIRILVAPEENASPAVAISATPPSE
jgi:hypothetical protein